MLIEEKNRRKKLKNVYNLIFEPKKKLQIEGIERRKSRRLKEKKIQGAVKKRAI